MNHLLQAVRAASLPAHQAIVKPAAAHEQLGAQNFMELLTHTLQKAGDRKSSAPVAAPPKEEAPAHEAETDHKPAEQPDPALGVAAVNGHSEPAAETTALTGEACAVAQSTGGVPKSGETMGQTGAVTGALTALPEAVESPAAPAGALPQTMAQALGETLPDVSPPQGQEAPHAANPPQNAAPPAIQGAAQPVDEQPLQAMLAAQAPAEAGKTATKPVAQAAAAPDASQTGPAALETSPTAAPDGVAAPMGGSPHPLHSATFEPARLAEAHTTGMVAQISQSVESLVKSHQTTLRIMLNPAELGRIDLRLTSGSAGMAVSLVAHNPATGQLLEAQLSQLRQSLDQAGIQLAHLSVGQQGGQPGTGTSGGQAHAQQRAPKAPAIHAAVARSAPAVERDSSLGLDYFA